MLLAIGTGAPKRLTLAPVYTVAKALLPTLDLSQLNIAYYASLANFYTVYDLRHLKPAQTYLYLLCVYLDRGDESILLHLDGDAGRVGWCARQAAF